MIAPFMLLYGLVLKNTQVVNYVFTLIVDIISCLIYNVNHFLYKFVLGVQKRELQWMDSLFVYFPFFPKP